jgi:hypothetical protein
LAVLTLFFSASTILDSLITDHTARDTFSSIKPKYDKHNTCKMTIVLPSQAHPDNECGHAAESFFSGADIEEFQRAMSEWQVPACTLVVDVPTAGDSQKGKAGHAAVWLLSSTTPEVRAYLGEDGDSLLPQAHKERDSFDAPGAADIQLEVSAVRTCSTAGHAAMCTV